MRPLAASLVVILFTSTCLHAQAIRRYYVVGHDGQCRVLDQQPTSEIISPFERPASDGIYISREDALAAIRTLPQCQPPIASTPQKRR